MELVQDYVQWLWGYEVNGIDSGLCTMAVFGISYVERWRSVIREIYQ
jgi:hypothetical protein